MFEIWSNTETKKRTPIKFKLLQAAIDFVIDKPQYIIKKPDGTWLDPNKP